MISFPWLSQSAVRSGAEDVPSFGAGFWSADPDAIMAQLSSAPGGLASSEVAAQLKRFGPNQIRQREESTRILRAAGDGDSRVRRQGGSLARVVRLHQHGFNLPDIEGLGHDLVGSQGTCPCLSLGSPVGGHHHDCARGRLAPNRREQRQVI
jgi:hypothetical protein